jgi:Fe-S cluster biogenesis protein NfuA/rhodanese-related sulfurtransferase
MSTQDETLTLSRTPETGTVPAPAVAEGSKNLVTLEQFLEKRRTGQTVYVFDIRPTEAYDAGHIPGAYSLPFQHIEANLHRLPFSGDLLFYDDGDGAVRQVEGLLNDNGFNDFWFITEGYTALNTAMRAAPGEVNYEALNPSEKAAKIEQVLDEKVREFLARDGGGMEVVAIEESKVIVSYQGACGSCSSSTAGTLRFIQGVLTISLNHEIEVVPVES